MEPSKKYQKTTKKYTKGAGKKSTIQKKTDPKAPVKKEKKFKNFNNNKKAAQQPAVQKPVKRKPDKAIIFAKHYEDFMQGINGINSILSESLQKQFEFDRASNIREVLNNILQVAEDNIPMIGTDTAYWEFKITASNSTIKTNEHLSFGWNRRPNGTYVFIVTLYGFDNNYFKKQSQLQELGFEKTTNPTSVKESK